MNMETKKEELADLIFRGLSSGYEKAKIDLSNETIYGVSLYSGSGFRGLAVAVNTSESLTRTKGKVTGLDAKLLAMLQDHQDLLSKVKPTSELYPEMNSCEWEYVYSELQELIECDDLIDQSYDFFYNDNYEINYISNWFYESIKSGINKFAVSLASGHQLLLGLQFADACNDELKMVEDVSADINSKEWHLKVVQNIKELTKNIT